MDEASDDAVIRQFFEDGYVVLQNCIPRAECQRFCRESLEPTLRKDFNVDCNNPRTWSLDNVSGYIMNEGSIEGTPVGVMIRDLENGGADPLQQDPDKRWPALFQSCKLLNFLDYLHGDGKNWQWLHDDNVGWIHARFPVLSTDEEIREKQLKTVQSFNWHVDGGHFDIHKINSLEQSVVVLPMICDVERDGGNTLVIRGSHCHIMRRLNEFGEIGVHKSELHRICENLAKNAPSHDIIEAAPCKAGDILVLHPFVIHCASVNTIGNCVRLTFNMGTRWSNSYALLDESCENDQSRSPMEKHILDEISVPKLGGV